MTESPGWTVFDPVVGAPTTDFDRVVLGLHLLNGTGPAKSFSSDVNEAELRVLPMNVERQGLSPSTLVRSTPISVKAFVGSCVITLPWLS